MSKREPPKTDPTEAPAEKTGKPQARAAADTAPEDVADVTAGAAAGDQQPKPPEEQEAEQADPLEQLRREVAEANDRALRNQAELENYRKRAARELQDVRRYGCLSLMRDLLPVLDNLHRTIRAAEQNHDTASLLEGVKLVTQQFEDVFAQHHCERIEAIHKPFDPHLHEAILQQPSAEHPPGTVMRETQTGFQLHDRVVRPSQVMVSAAEKQDTEEEPDKEEPEKQQEE